MKTGRNTEILIGVMTINATTCLDMNAVDTDADVAYGYFTFSVLSGGVS